MSLASIQIKMIKRLLDTATDDKIAHALDKIHPSELSFLFSELNENQTRRLIDSLTLLAKAGQTLRELPDFLLPDVLEQISDKKFSDILLRMEPDDSLFLLQKTPEGRWPILLEALPELQRSRIEKLLIYPNNSAGSVMTSNYITVRSEMTAQEAVEHLRSHPEIKGAFYIYVVDDTNHLVGVQSLRQLVMAPLGTRIKDIMDRDARAVLATDDQEKVAQIVGQYNLLAIPVTNEQRELVGVITVDDVIDIVKEEATEDIYHLAGLSEADRAMTPVATKVKKRLPWMILNLITASLAATVVGFFLQSIEKFVALAVFLPIVAGVGGNGGMQSLTVITRSIALGELDFVKVHRAVLREIGNGMIVGAICGALMGLIGFLWKGNFYLGLILFLAMVCNVIMGALAGALFPIFFKFLKRDPAIGTSVLVTFFTDTFGFLSFLGLATFFLQYLG